MTSIYQHLDVLINRNIKQIGKRLWRENLSKNENIKITNKDSIVHFLEAFKLIKRSTVIKFFKISCLQKDTS